MRILTHTGMVDVTDDHSLVKNTGEEISPKDVEIGTALLHTSYNAIIGEGVSPSIEDTITPEEAKIMGFFFGDGSCGIYNCPSGKKASWALNNSNKELLQKYLNLCKKVYPEFEWKIYDTIKVQVLINYVLIVIKNMVEVKLSLLKIIEINYIIVIVK